MMELLKKSVAAIEHTNEIQKEQNDVIQETVSINEAITGGINRKIRNLRALQIWYRTIQRRL